MTVANRQFRGVILSDQTASLWGSLPALKDTHDFPSSLIDKRNQLFDHDKSKSMQLGGNSFGFRSEGLEKNPFRNRGPDCYGEVHVRKWRISGRDELSDFNLLSSRKVLIIRGVLLLGPERGLRSRERGKELPR